MTDSQSAFLCGLLKSCRPKKILEVGVAGGATTAIILQALEDLGEPYEMHSVDVAEKFYRDHSKPVGFLATFAKENNLITPLPNQPYAANINFISENFYHKSSTKSAEILILLFSTRFIICPAKFWILLLSCHILKSARSLSFMTQL